MLVLLLVMVSMGTSHGTSGVEPGPERSPALPTRKLTEAWMTQQLDHWDPLELRTWQQRYYVNSEWYVEGGPVFVFAEGVLELNSRVITSGLVGQLAERFGALALMLEHRFFGRSHPLPDVTVESLRYLTVEQGMADLAHFTSTLGAQLNLTGPWVVFGASYSGALSAWARAKYPHLYTAAFASSAIVFAQLEIPEYFEVVAAALLLASPECPGLVTSAVSELKQMVARGEGQLIGQLFNLCEVVLNTSNAEDVATLHHVVARFWDDATVVATPNSLAGHCNVLVEGAARGELLEAQAALVTGVNMGSCTTASFTDLMSSMRGDVNYTDDWSRRWLWQQCTQFGFFATLSSEDHPLGYLFDLDFLVRWCTEVFGQQFTESYVTTAVSRTNLDYGGLSPNVTRVIYTHGSVDPWRVTGVQESADPERPVIIIDGASHCRDLLPETPEDSVALKDARRQIADILAEWLDQLGEI